MIMNEGCTQDSKIPSRKRTTINALKFLAAAEQAITIPQHLNTVRSLDWNIWKKFLLTPHWTQDILQQEASEGGDWLGILQRELPCTRSFRAMSNPGQRGVRPFWSPWWMQSRECLYREIGRSTCQAYKLEFSYSLSRITSCLFDRQWKRLLSQHMPPSEQI